MSQIQVEETAFNGEETAFNGGSERPSGVFWGLLLLTALLYAPTLANGLVWDDHFLLSQDARVTGPLSFSALLRPYWTNLPDLTSGGVVYARPLVTLSFAVQHAVSGLLPWPFHLVNVLLHLLNGVLLERWLRPKLGQTLAAGGVGIWLLHPTAVEAVAWISGRTDLLAMTCGLLGLLAWERAREGAPGRFDLLAALALVGAGMSKEVALLFWPVLLATLLRSQTKVRTRGLNVLLVSGLLCLWVRVESLRVMSVEPAAPLGLEPWWLPFVRAAVSAGQLLSVWAWPFNPSALVAGKSLPPPGSPLVWGGACVLLGLALGLALSLKRFWTVRPQSEGAADALSALQGWLWLSLGLLPVLNFVPLSAPSPVAERFWYLPSVGLLLLLGLSVRRRWPFLLERAEAGARVPVGVVAAVPALERVASMKARLLALPMRTRVLVWLLSGWLLASAGVVVARGREWRSDVTLWRAELARHGVRHILGARNVGLALRQEGDEAAAL